MMLIIKLILILVSLAITYFAVNKLINVLISFHVHAKERLAERKENIKKLKPSFDLKGLFEAYSEPAYTKKIKIYASIIGFISGLIVTTDFIFSIIFAVISCIIASVIIKNIISSNKKKFEQQLVEALSIISTSVKTGASLTKAFENVVQQAKMPMLNEFNEILKQINLGVPVSSALKDFEKRIESYDLHLAVLVMNVTREYGGNLAENLSIIANTIIERKKIRDKVNAITSQGRLSAWIITLIPFLLLLVLNFMEPSMFGLMFTTLLGKLLLCIAVLMTAVGNYLIMKIVTIDV